MGNTTDNEELRLVAALTAVLRRKRLDLIEGGPATLSPIWQPLLDELGCFTQQRADRPQAPSAELRVGVQALQQEYDGLKHSLEVWSAALQQAMAASRARGAAAPVYGATPTAGNTIGRG